MSILNTNINEFRTSIAKNRILTLGYKQTTKTKPQSKKKKKNHSLNCEFSKDYKSKSELNILTVK